MKTKYRIRIKGKNCDYFLNLLIQKKISIYSFEKEDSNYILLIDQDDYKKVKKIKTSYQIDVLDIYGYSRLKSILRRHFTFVLSFLICFFLLIASSFFIFDISVLTSDSSLKKIILEDLKVRGVSRFQLQKSYSRRNQIIEEILEEEKNRIEWIELERVGTKYLIHVVERVKNKKEESCVPQNIVSKKDAFIVRIEADSGEVVTALHRNVKKGDILISGEIHNKEDIMNRRCARGHVFGEVWYQVMVEVPKHYYEENVTGKVHRGIGFEFFSLRSKSYFKTYKSREYPILENNVLPIRIYYSEAMETNVIEKDFTIHNIDSFGLKIATEKLKNKIPKDSVIVTKKILKKQEKNSRIIIGVFFKVIEDISEVKLIEEESYVRESE